MKKKFVEAARQKSLGLFKLIESFFGRREDESKFLMYDKEGIVELFNPDEDRGYVIVMGSYDTYNKSKVYLDTCEADFKDRGCDVSGNFEDLNRRIVGFEFVRTEI